jgi:hypothetical protein
VFFTFVVSLSVKRFEDLEDVQGVTIKGNDSAQDVARGLVNNVGITFG